MKRTLLLLSCIFCALSVTAQDKHFTQFYAAPLTLNPALTGAFNGSFRVSAIYRDQWRSVLDKPYTTFGASADVRFDVEWIARHKDAVAIGLLFFSDNVQGIDFSTNQIALSFAFHKGLGWNRKQYLSLGLQFGLAQRNIGYENLTFQDEFNGIDGFVPNSTAEGLPENNFSFADYSVGLNYTFQPKDRLGIYAGFALHHILTPQVSFYTSEEINGDSQLFMKLSGQLSAELPLSDRISILPRFLFSNQGPHWQINTGANLKYLLTDFNANAIHIGSWVRPVGNESGGISVDAIVLMLGIQYQSVLFGISYDVNLNDLANDRQGQGAFEFSISYIGNFDNETILCPKF